MILLSTPLFSHWSIPLRKKHSKILKMYSNIVKYRYVLVCSLLLVRTVRTRVLVRVSYVPVLVSYNKRRTTYTPTRNLK
jgi:hypothetical protein